MSSTNYAGFWLRLAAYILDYFIIQIAQSIFILPLLAFMGFDLLKGSEEIDLEWLSQAEPAVALNVLFNNMGELIVLGLVISLLYYAFMESSKYKATVGKLVLRLEVIDLNGVQLNLGLALVRNFSKLFSTLFFLIGYLLIGLTPKKQGLHDMMANTLVVRRE
ncbi:MAG: putative RDD family membrane protein YckC, partial [Marinoscillum sp.]